MKTFVAILGSVVAAAVILKLLGFVFGIIIGLFKIIALILIAAPIFLFIQNKLNKNNSNEQ